MPPSFCSSRRYPRRSAATPGRRNGKREKRQGGVIHLAWLRPSDILILAAPPVQRRRRLLLVFSLSFGQCVLLPVAQEFNQLFPRVEAKRPSGIHLFDTSFELFMALFALASKAYYKSSLHDQLQLTAGPRIQREKTVEFP